MYGPPRSWDRGSPRTYGPPGRFPRKRSRSPVPTMGDRYAYSESPMGPPMRSNNGPPLYGRGARMNDPVFPSQPRYEEFGGGFDGRPPFRGIEGANYYGGPSRPERRPVDRREVDRSPQQYDKRPSLPERPEFRTQRYPQESRPTNGDYYGRDVRRRDYPSPGRRMDMPNEQRGYPPEEYPSFVPPKEFVADEARQQQLQPRRRSPDPRYNYRPIEKPAYPPRNDWYRGPSPPQNRWR